MKYLLDTCVISDFVKGEENTINRIKGTPSSQITISSITVMEISYGLHLNPTRAKKISVVIRDFLDAITILDFSPQDAQKSAVIRAILKQDGCPIGSYDILLAGTALNRGLILVTANTKEFNRVKDLHLENWR